MDINIKEIEYRGACAIHRSDIRFSTYNPLPVDWIWCDIVMLANRTHNHEVLSLTPGSTRGSPSLISFRGRQIGTNFVRAFTMDSLGLHLKGWRPCTQAKKCREVGSGEEFCPPTENVSNQCLILCILGHFVGLQIDAKNEKSYIKPVLQVVLCRQV